MFTWRQGAEAPPCRQGTPHRQDANACLAIGWKGKCKVTTQSLCMANFMSPWLISRSYGKWASYRWFTFWHLKIVIFRTYVKLPQSITCASTKKTSCHIISILQRHGVVWNRGPSNFHGWALCCSLDGMIFGILRFQTHPNHPHVCVFFNKLSWIQWLWKALKSSPADVARSQPLANAHGTATHRLGTGRFTLW